MKAKLSDVKELKFMADCLIVIMLISAAVAIISPFWVPRMYDIEEINKILTGLVFMWIGVTCGILALIADITAILIEMKRRHVEVRIFLPQNYIRKMFGLPSLPREQLKKAETKK